MESETFCKSVLYSWSRL